MREELAKFFRLLKSMQSEKIRRSVVCGIIAGVVVGIIALVILLQEQRQRHALAAWQVYTSQAVADAKAAHKPVMIDFYADWCEACKAMNYYIFRSKRFQTAASDFVLLRANMTNEYDPSTQRLSREFQIEGFPIVVFLDKNGQERTDLRVEGAYSDWEAFLDSFLTAMELVRTGAPIPEPPKQ